MSGKVRVRVHNMGNIERQEAEAFARAVLDRENYPDWVMEWGCAPSICIHDRKVVVIKEKILKHGYPWEVKQEILHEIAHIPRTEEKGHGPNFFREFVRLVTAHLVENPL